MLDVYKYHHAVAIGSLFHVQYMYAHVCERCTVHVITNLLSLCHFSFIVNKFGVMWNIPQVGGHELTNSDPIFSDSFIMSGSSYMTDSGTKVKNLFSSVYFEQNWWKVGTSSSSQKYTNKLSKVKYVFLPFSYCCNLYHITLFIFELYCRRVTYWIKEEPNALKYTSLWIPFLVQ